ncbi:MAG: zf-HC2 domain-containing protein [Candidatus Zixiibacteriota bacterium]|nr:MAG: zf-HC2 domain-containing protein [candidate division Zixibacteria bacterium]
MNCQDALDLLYDIIDREASEIDAQRVKEHLDNCRDCFEVYRLEQSVQDLINERVQNSFDTPKVDELKAKIISRLDEIDRENPNKRETSFFRLSTRTLVAAASLVILIGASFMIAAFYRHNDLYKPLERAHWSAEENPNEFQNSPVTSAILADIQQNHRLDLAPELMDYRMIGGGTREIMGARMNHLVYTNDDGFVSVFLVPADQFEISSDLQETRIVKGGIVFFDHNCRGCRLVYHRAGSLVVITASTDRELDLYNFVPEQSII